ncbi:MAG: glycoside hydrolase family 2 TIM barrel-domain containing protein [Candidatus Omnitrophota bacterium]
MRKNTYFFVFCILATISFLPFVNAQEISEEKPDRAVGAVINEEIPAGVPQPDPILLPGEEQADPEVPESVREPDIDPDAPDSAACVQQAWELSNQGKLEELNDLVEECLKYYKEAALVQQKGLEDFPTVTQRAEYQILNDVGTILFIRAEALMNYGRTEEAVKRFEEIIEQFPWAQAWDPRGWFWSVKEKSQDSIKVIKGIVDDDAVEDLPKLERTTPTLAFPGTENVVNYQEYGEFKGVGTQNYEYQANDPEALSNAVGQGIYPNTSAVYRDPRYQELKESGRFDGLSHWDYVHSNDLETAFYLWATAREPWGVKQFYIAQIFEKAEMYYEALKAYHAIVVHFPQTVAWTYWQTPWYPAQAAIAKIEHLIRFHPELNLGVKWMSLRVKNGFDNDVSNDIMITYPGVIYERNWWEDLKESVQDWIDKEELGDPVRTLGEGEVRLVQYENGHWQMLVDGEPYVIHGITYAPTKIGQSPDKGTLVSWMREDTNENGLPDGPYDAWVDANRNNEQDADEPVVGDFQLMVDMGVNTIREYHQPFHPSKEVLRKMYDEYGIRVIMGDFLGKYTLGSGATWFEGTDYENPEHQKNMMDSVRRMVEEFKDEPYILMWLLGNENNYGVASNADQKPEAYFKFANRVAKMIKEIDPDHPVALCNGDTLYLDIFGKHAPDIDIFSANVYRGDYGFGAYWEQVKDAADRPAFITEYGAPAFARHLTLKEAEEAQALYHRGNWLDIEANMAGKKDSVGNALGGVVFEWTDEWWKNYEPFYHDKRSDAIGPFPGGYYYEEWFGITSQGKGRHSPFMRQLRDAYFAYQEMWNAED